MFYKTFSLVQEEQFSITDTYAGVIGELLQYFYNPVALRNRKLIASSISQEETKVTWYEKFKDGYTRVMEGDSEEKGDTFTYDARSKNRFSSP